MRLVFLGTPEFAVPTLNALSESRHQVVLVVSQPDRPKGRGHKLAPTPVKEAALRAGLPVEQPEKLKEIRDLLINLKPEAVIVVAFGQKIPKWLLELPPHGCINLHPSLLPKYRGAAPIPAAIRNQERITGITSMRLDEGWDTGEILLQKQVPIGPGETGGELHDRLMHLGAELILETLERLEKGTLIPVPQDDRKATYAPKLGKEMARIDWNQTSQEIVAQIRALNPWPVAWTIYGEVILKIWEAEESRLPLKRQKPGEIVKVAKEGLFVQATNGLVKVTRLQRPGGKPMDTASFLNGFSLSEGTNFS